MATHINPAIPANISATGLVMALLWLAGMGIGIALADDVPIPQPRPSLWTVPHTFREAASPDFNSADVTSAPTACDQRLGAIAVFEPMPRLIGPGSCGGGDMVRLNAVTRPGGARIELQTAPILRCPFAELLAAWLRDEAAPRADKSSVPPCMQSRPTMISNAAVGTGSLAPNSANTARVTRSICAHLSWPMAGS